MPNYKPQIINVPFLNDLTDVNSIDETLEHVYSLFRHLIPDLGVKGIFSNFGHLHRINHICTIVSITMSCIIFVTVMFHIRQRSFKERPSFRLSASIAIGNICLSAVLIAIHPHGVIEAFSDVQLRLLLWVSFAGIACSIFVPSFIAFHLHLTVVLRKARLARKLSKYYELAAWFICFITTHQIMYIGNKIAIIENFRTIIMIDKTNLIITLKIWSIIIWMVIAIVYCIVVCVLVTIRCIPLLRSKHPDQRIILPEGSGGPLSDNFNEVSISDEVQGAATTITTATQFSGNGDEIMLETLNNKQSQLPLQSQHPSHVGVARNQRPHHGQQQVQGLSHFLYDSSEEDSGSNESNSISTTSSSNPLPHKHSQYHNNNNNNNNNNGQFTTIQIPQPPPIIPTTTTTAITEATTATVISSSSLQQQPRQIIIKKSKEISRSSQKVSPLVRKCRRNAVFAILRIMIYPLIPVVYAIMFIVGISIELPKYSFLMATLIILSLQGIIDFVIFALNPVFDSVWENIWKWVKNFVCC